jgi:hypothetical protein
MKKKYNISTDRVRPSDRDKIPFLTKEQFKEFNLVGGSGKNNKGIKTTREEYLNTLKIGEFSVNSLKHNGDKDKEELLIIFVPKKNFKEPTITPEMLPWVQVDIKEVMDFAKLYIDFRVSDRYHEDDEADWKTEMADKVLEALYGKDIFDQLKEK